MSAGLNRLRLLTFQITILKIPSWGKLIFLSVLLTFSIGGKMLKKMIALGIFLILITSRLNFSQEKKVTEPEMINVIYYLDSVNNKLIPLERQIAKTKTKRSMLGYAGIKKIKEIEGIKSTFILKSDMNQEFIVQLPVGIDPAKIQLFQFDIKKDKRILLLQRTFLTQTAGPGPIQINITKYGQSSYKLTPMNKLECEEFGFILNIEAEISDVFCFGIEPGE